MDKVTVANVAAKKRSPADDDGDIRYAIKAHVRNSTREPLNVHLRLQGVDADGFEVQNILMTGIVGPQTEEIFTDAGYMSEADFDEIDRWRIKDCDSYDID